MEKKGSAFVDLFFSTETNEAAKGAVMASPHYKTDHLTRKSRSNASPLSAVVAMFLYFLFTTQKKTGVWSLALHPSMLCVWLTV